MRLPAPLLAALATALCLLAFAAPADARTGPCVAGRSDGPVCTVWTGTVTFVADGDTLDVDVAGDGTRRPVRVRITGIQAMEQTVYASDPRRRRGECHALAATRRLERLISRSGGRVRLAAQEPASRSGTRMRRSIAVRFGGGWHDVGPILVGEGHALWLPNPVEHAWNAELARLSEDAARAGRRLWDPDACGPGPEAPGALGLVLKWDADGDDARNVNGEWMRVVNRSGAPVPLGGWWVRDSHLRRFRFPAWAVVAPGSAVTVHVGGGSADGSAFHWGLTAPAFENADPSRGMGDGAYLFDPHGDLRAWVIYR